MSLKSPDSLHLGYIQIDNFSFGVGMLKKYKPNKCHEMVVYIYQKPIVKIFIWHLDSKLEYIQSSAEAEGVVCVGVWERNQRLCLI